MSGLTGIIAGFAAIVGAVALYRLAGDKLARAQDAVRGRRSTKDGAPVLDFERDQTTGVFRPK